MKGAVDHRHEEFLLSGFDSCVYVLSIPSTKFGFLELVNDPTYPDSIARIGHIHQAVAE